MTVVRHLITSSLLVVALASVAPDVAVSRNTGAIHRARALLIALRRRRRGAYTSTHTSPPVAVVVLPAVDRWDGLESS